MELPKTKRSIREFIRTGAFEKAMALASAASSQAPSDGELQYLWAAALFDRSIQLDNLFFDASARSYGARSILKTVKEHEVDFPGSLGLVAEAASRENRGLGTAMAGAKRARGLRERARAALNRVSEGHVSFPQAALLKAWICAYELVSHDNERYFTRIAKALKVPDPEPTDAPDPPVDARELRKSSLAALASLVKREPASARPYFAAAEWFSFTGVKDTGHPVLLERERTARYQEGISGQDAPPFPPGAVEELAQVRKLPIPGFADLRSSHIIPLLERAKALDTKREYPVAYALYVQVCPIDRVARRALLDEAFGEKSLASLAALERARLVWSEDATPTAMLSYLEQARRTRSFSRPMFRTIPPEVRGTLLSGRGVWRSLWLNGFAYRGLLQGQNRVTASADTIDGKVRSLLLRASICELLTYSDLPQDWMLGASKQADCLAEIIRTPGIPDDLRARTALAADRLRSSVSLRSAPLSSVCLSKGRVEFTTAPEAGGSHKGPFIFIDLATGMIGWSPIERARR